MGLPAGAEANGGRDRIRLDRYEATEVHMGTKVTIVLYAPDPSLANRALADAFDQFARVDAIFSDYRGDSEIMRLADEAPHNEPHPVSDPLWVLLRQSQLLYERTGGAFDVTVGPYSRLWRRAQRQQRLPSANRLAEARTRVGSDKLRLDESEQAVQMTVAGMRLDFGGIAKGFAADLALEAMQGHGVRSVLVNAGGDVVAGAPPPGQDGWEVTLVTQRREDEDREEIVLVERCGVATSGDAWQFVEIDGVRYSHLLDPRTGYGLTRRVAATVVAPDGALADGLASACCVMDREDAEALLDHYPDTAFRLVEVVDGTPRVWKSACWDRLAPAALPGLSQGDLP